MALAVDELTTAFADFQALMRAARLAREEAVQEVARRRDAAVDEAREAELERKRLKKERAEKREAALRRQSKTDFFKKPGAACRGTAAKATLHARERDLLNPPQVARS